MNYKISADNVTKDIRVGSGDTISLTFSGIEYFLQSTLFNSDLPIKRVYINDCGNSLFQKEDYIQSRLARVDEKCETEDIKDIVFVFRYHDILAIGLRYFKEIIGNRSFMTDSTFSSKFYLDLYCKTLRDINLSEVIIDCPLTFDMNYVAQLKKEYSVEVVVDPVGACKDILFDPLCLLQNYNSFYVLPEHVSLYEDYINSMQFPANLSKDTDLTLFKIYSVQKTWLGRPSELIYRLNISSNSMVAVRDMEFARTRLTCKQACVENIDYPRCHKCRTSFELSVALEELNDEDFTL